MKMANSIDRTSKCGFLNMTGKVNMGVPRAKVSGKSGAISKQDSRGKSSCTIRG